MIRNWQNIGRASMRILVDTNILLDYILDREPYGEAARCVVKACKDGTIKGCIAAHSISNMFFILRKGTFAAAGWAD